MIQYKHSKKDSIMAGLTPTQKALYNYSGLNFALYRQSIKTNIPLNNFITDPTPDTITKEEVVSEITKQDNVELIADTIIRRNDIGLAIDRPGIITKVNTYLKSWINLGKFNTIDIFVSFPLAINHYNKEFVTEFADIILPVDVTKVPNVVNPNGMYAQQTQTLSFKSKKIPFYEHSLYKRLEAKTNELPMDESEDFFYKFQETGKKIPKPERNESSLDREGLAFRMNPNY